MGEWAVFLFQEQTDEHVYPRTGLYLSTKKVKGMRLVVEDVFAEEGDDFYLVNVIDEASKDDFSAMGDEMDGEQWEALVAEYGLVHQG